MEAVSNRHQWGAWWSLAFYGLFLLATSTVGLLVLFGYFMIHVTEEMEISGGGITPETVQALGITPQTIPELALWSSWPLAVCQCALAAALVRLRKGKSVRDYLGLRRVAGKALLPWLGLKSVLILIVDLTQLVIGRPIVPDVMINQYTNTWNLLLLWSVAIFAAPISEEIVFRGFLMMGFVNSRLGTIGGILVTSMLWAILHAQYDAFGIASVAVTGIALGYSRTKTGSILPAIAMHVFGNMFAFIETAVIVAYAH